MPALPANTRRLRDLQLAPRVMLAHIQQPQLRSAARFAGRTPTLRQAPLRATARLATRGELMHVRRARLGASRRSRVMRPAVCVRPASFPTSQPRSRATNAPPTPHRSLDKKSVSASLAILAQAPLACFAQLASTSLRLDRATVLIVQRGNTRRRRLLPTQAPALTAQRASTPRL